MDLNMYKAIDLDKVNSMQSPETGGANGAIQRVLNEWSGKGWSLQDVIPGSVILTKLAEDEAEFKSHVKETEQAHSTKRKAATTADADTGNTKSDSKPAPTAHKDNQKLTPPVDEDADDAHDEVELEELDRAGLLLYAQQNKIKVSANDSKPVLIGKIEDWLLEAELDADEA